MHPTKLFSPSPTHQTLLSSKPNTLHSLGCLEAASLRQGNYYLLFTKIDSDSTKNPQKHTHGENPPNSNISFLFVYI